MNSVALIGNLTADPELRHTPSGQAVCSLRIAVNDRQKEGDEWVDKPYYFNVTVWGNHGESCAMYLSKGKKVGVSGKLTWREWEAQDGTKRQAVEVTAHQVEFLTPRDGNSSPSQPPAASQSQTTAPALVGSDDDIPF